MKRFSRDYARHVVARLRREAQRILPASMQVLPRRWTANTRSVVDTERVAPVDPAHTITRRLPRTLDSAIDWEFTTRREFDSPPTFVVTLAHGRALEHAAIAGDGTLLADLSIEPGVLPADAATHSSLLRRAVPKLESLGNRAIVTSVYGGADNYFHWMFDLLPRFDILARSGIPLGDTPVVVSGTTTSFQRETLAELGITNPVDGGRHPFVTARELVVPSLPGVMGDVTKASCEFLRRTFLPATAPVGRRRLFLSRAKARYRRLENERELLAILEPLGFSVVDAEGMSVRAQAALFASAEVVIAPHGAALTNTVFCAPGTVVVELFSPTYVNGCYWCVANQVGLDYWYLLGEGERPASDDTHRGASDDYRVDPNALLALTERTRIHWR